MGVYINMEMPTDGGVILVYKIRGKFFAARAGKDELFPLVPVPPHGRLIDADAMKKKWTHKDLDLFSQGWCWLQDLNKAPTVIPASEEG